MPEKMHGLGICRADTTGAHFCLFLLSSVQERGPSSRLRKPLWKLPYNESWKSQWGLLISAWTLTPVTKRRGKPGHLRVVDTAVVEDKAGAGEGHAGLLRLELQLDNMMVSYKAEPTSGGQGRFKTQVKRPLAAMHSGRDCSFGTLPGFIGP